MDAQTRSQWLSALVAPVSVAEFLSTYWLKQHLFCRGAPDRFAPLVSWPVINDILERHWRETYRFRLARQGRDLDPASYADFGGVTPRIRASDVTEELRRGATLSFDAIDEVHPPLTRLAESFEAFFRGGTKINIYAGWRSLHGLDLHRDNQEIFILQIDGRKRWLLYGFSFDGVDRGDLSTTSQPPAGAALDRILEPGDLLYIPRGCYHLALPLNEPALHLTLGVKNPRGLDLVLWLVDRMRASEIANRDVPFLAGSDDRRRFAAELQRAIFAELGDDLVEQYFVETGSNFKPRPSFSLPWSATPEGLPPGRAFHVRLKTHGRIAMRATPDAAALEVHVGGRSCRFPRSMRIVLEALCDGTPQPMGRIIDGAGGRIDEPMARMLVGMLLRQDLVAVTS